MEFEFIKDTLPVKRQRTGEYATVIRQWLSSENKTIIFKCKTVKEANHVQAAVYAYRKKRNEDYTVFKKDPLTIVLVKA